MLSSLSSFLINLLHRMGYVTLERDDWILEQGRHKLAVEEGETLRQELQACGAALAGARADLDRAKARIADLDSDLDAARADVASATSDLKASRSEMNALRMELAATQRNLGALDAECGAARARDAYSIKVLTADLGHERLAHAEARRRLAALSKAPERTDAGTPPDPAPDEPDASKPATRDPAPERESVDPDETRR